MIQLNETGLTPNPYPASPLVCPGGGSLTFTSVPLSGGSPYSVTAVASDPSNNQTLSDVFSVVIDAVAPDVDIVRLPAQSPTTNTLPIFFEVTFSEAIDTSTFSSADILNTGTASGGVWTVLNNGDDQTFTLSVNALVSDGTVIPSIVQNIVSDLAGNQNTASTSSGPNIVTYDGTVPSAPIITEPFFTQSATPTLTVSCETNENLEFVITPYGGTNPVTAVCSGGTASVPIPSALGADGTYTILPTAIDGVGNRTDGNLFTLVLDGVSPTPTINLSAGQNTLTNTSPIFFEVSWDEPIDASTFTGVDIINTGTAVGGVWSVANSGDSQNFVISVTSLTGDGTVIPEISAGVSNDQALNLNLVGAYTGTPVTLDSQAPDQPVVTGPAFTSSSTPSLAVTCDPSSTVVTLLIPGYAGSPVAGGACSRRRHNILNRISIGTHSVHSRIRISCSISN
jgi:hypothetical protein